MKKKRLVAIAQEVAKSEFVLHVPSDEKTKAVAYDHLDNIISKYKLDMVDMLEVDNLASEILEKMLDNYKRNLI